MNQEIKDRWVAALESGEYRQGIRVLHQVNGDAERFCCLGVLCDLAYRDGVVPRKISGSVDDDANVIYFYGAMNMSSLPPEVVEWAGVPTSNPFVTYAGAPRQLAYVNDHTQLPFADIAILIKEHL